MIGAALWWRHPSLHKIEGVLLWFAVQMSASVLHILWRRLSPGTHAVWREALTAPVQRAWGFGGMAVCSVLHKWLSHAPPDWLAGDGMAGALRRGSFLVWLSGVQMLLFLSAARPVRIV